MPRIDAQHPILVICGTNREGSNCLKVARLTEADYREAGVPVDVLSLDEMPAGVFSPTAYAKRPEGWQPLQERVLDAAGLHVITPEYNGSFPGVLKLFIDMLKFPDSFEAKPVCFTGEANGRWGALRSVEQLQQIFGYRNAHIFPVRVFCPGIKSQLDEHGHFRDPELAARLRAQTQQFAAFVRKL